jgi:hypothetical protein
MSNIDEDERKTLLSDVWATFPKDALLNLAHRYQPEARTGVPDAVAVPAYMAGLTADEVTERHANGTLDQDAVEVLRALQAGSLR